MNKTLFRTRIKFCGLTRPGDARLAWFYERTPFYDQRFRLYPVGREN